MYFHCTVKFDMVFSLYSIIDMVFSLYSKDLDMVFSLQ